MGSKVVLFGDSRLPERFWNKVAPDGPDECWIWTAAKMGTQRLEDGKGYGYFFWEGRAQGAHRVSYKVFVGVIEVGQEIDHTCQQSLCMNPRHLQSVTPEVNRDLVTTRRTHCKRGHPFSEENTYVRKNGKRDCRKCSRDYERERRWRLANSGV